MKTYKDVCGNNRCVWFAVEPNNDQAGVDFLQWAKDIGCVWLNGEEIQPENGASFFHFSIHNDGKLANVSMMIWSYHPDKSIPRHNFSQYIKGNRTLVYTVVEFFCGGKTLPEVKGVYLDRAQAQSVADTYPHAFVEYHNLIQSQWEKLPTDVYVALGIMFGNVPSVLGVFESEEQATKVAGNYKYDAIVIKSKLT